MNVLTQDRALEEQSNLGALCADRPLITNEVFPPNALYGISHVLKSYAGASPDEPMCGVVPHGIVFNKTYIWEVEIKARVPVVFNHSLHRLPVFRSQTGKVIIPSASPFLYAMHQAKQGNNEPAARKGTIFFPVHSSHYIINKIDAVEDLISALDHLDDKFKPVTICIYWKDFLLGHHLPFVRRGYNIVSAGHMFDKDFLFRLYHLCSQYMYSSSNELGSHLFFSLASGCKYFHVNHDKYDTEISPDSPRKDRLVKIENGIIPKTLLSDGVALDGEVAEKLLSDFLGARYVRTPDQLLQDLKFAQRLDRIGAAKYWENKQLYFHMPQHLVRQAATVVRPVARVAKKFVRGIPS